MTDFRVARAVLVSVRLWFTCGTAVTERAKLFSLRGRKMLDTGNACD